MIFAGAILLAFVASANARCDNGCSGHGNCQFDEVCSCYDNWGVGMADAHTSGDCSERVFPYELAWVDTPNKDGLFHRYAECAGKGLCDRSSGECQCFEGYEGKACARSSCPNDCSGHGTCEYISDLGYGKTWNDIPSAVGFSDSLYTFNYYGWDAAKVRGCVCDATYGDVDCSKRLCPYGNDVLDRRLDETIGVQYHVQTIHLYNSGAHANQGEANDVRAIVSGMNKETFAMSFVSAIGETYTTIPIVFDTTNNGADMVKDMELALKSLPNKVIDGVTITYAPSSANDAAKFMVTFTGESVQCDQNLLIVHDRECSNGCTPKITGLSLNTVTTKTYPNTAEGSPNTNSVTTATSTIAQSQAADFNSYECGRRGSCDYGTGQCACFTGYSGESCGMLTTLL